MCTRVFNNFKGKENSNDYFSTARNMDWATQLPTSIFTFTTTKENPTCKQGIAKSESVKGKTLEWDAIYSSIVTMVGDETTGYAASDGMNSEGLVANLLYDSHAKYDSNDIIDTTERLDVLRWVQYVLDTCKDVKTVVAKFPDYTTSIAKNPDYLQKIYLVGGEVPSTGKVANLHLAISDSSGNSAIIEIYDGHYRVHENEVFRIMTNEPSYDTQILLNQYWRWQWSKKNDFPSNTLPGGPFPSDRFARASFYLNHLNLPKSAEDSLAQSKSVVMNACVPVAFNSKALKNLGKHPNIAQTLWTTISDHKNKVYYFSNARTLGNIFFKMENLTAAKDAPKTKALIVVEELKKDIFENKSFYGNIENIQEFIAVSDPYELVPTFV